MKEFPPECPARCVCGVGGTTLQLCAQIWWSKRLRDKEYLKPVYAVHNLILGTSYSLIVGMSNR